MTRNAKFSKAAAGYQARPMLGQACDQCEYWLGVARCSKVEGTISPKGWCQFFEASHEGQDEEGEAHE